MGFFKNLFEKLKGNKDIKDNAEKVVTEGVEIVKDSINDVIDEKRDVILDRFR